MKFFDLNKNVWQWITLLFLAIIWGSSFILMKKALIGLTAIQLGALRILIAGLFLLLIGFKSLKTTFGIETLEIGDQIVFDQNQKKSFTVIEDSIPKGESFLWFKKLFNNYKEEIIKKGIKISAKNLDKIDFTTISSDGWTSDEETNTHIGTLLHNFNIKANDLLGAFKRKQFKVSLYSSNGLLWFRRYGDSRRQP